MSASSTNSMRKLSRTRRVRGPSPVILWSETHAGREFHPAGKPHLSFPTAGHHLHHLADLIELFDELVDLLNGRPGSLSDARTAAPFDDRRVVALLDGHGSDDRFDLRQ